MSEPNGAAPNGQPASDVIAIVSVAIESDHARLSGCNQEQGWRWVAASCPKPQWTSSTSAPITHTLGEKMQIVVSFDSPKAPEDSVELQGKTAEGIQFQQSAAMTQGMNSVTMSSTEPLPRKLMKISFDLKWSVSNDWKVIPESTGHVAFLTFGPPPVAPKMRYGEDGATPKRMDAAVEWASKLMTLEPHAIVAGLMRRFPYYALMPNPDVPSEYNHPRYFNEVGGAWPMVDYVKASGECQAIVRLVRGMLAVIGAPGDVRVIVVWGDPLQGGGEKPIIDDWEKNPSAGLSRRRRMGSKQLVAALVDSPVTEGKTYPRSHTPMPDGSSSPGLNRYEACLEFSHGGVTRYYCGGAGVVSSKRELLKVFWGLVWVEFLPDDGFRVEKIVTRYQSNGPIAPRERDRPMGGRFRRFWRRLTRGET